MGVVILIAGGDQEVGIQFDVVTGVGTKVKDSCN